MHHRTVGATIASAIAFSVLAACSTDNTSDDFLTWDEKNAEYKAAIADFPYPLPSGVTFPPEIQGEPEGGTLYGKGLGEGDAWFFWECAHQRNYLDSLESPSAEATKSLDLLDKFPDTEWYKNHVQDPEGAYRAALKSARLGDPTALREYYAGCENLLSQPSTTQQP